MTRSTPLFSNIVRPPSPIILAMLVVVAALACGTDGATDGSSAAGTGGEITVTLTAPTKPAENQKKLLAGEFVVAGKFSATKGIKVTKVYTILPNETSVTFTIAAGNTFTGTLTTQKLDKLPADKVCGKKVSLSINASDAKGDNIGSAPLEFEIDHCAPGVKLESPPPPDPKNPTLTPVYIGIVPIKGHILDPNFASGVLGWRKAGESDITTIKVLTKPGSFEEVLDRTKEATAELEIVVNGVDNAGNPTEIVAPITVLRQPSFLGNTDDNDQFVWGKIVDVAAFDVNGDQVLDVVFGGPNGLVVRMGLTEAAADGSLKGTGRFETEKVVKTNKLGSISEFKGKKIEISKLLVTDLDKNGIVNDLVAVGSLGGVPAVIGFFHQTLTDKAVGAKSAVLHFGFRPMAALHIDEVAVTAEIAHINQDGRDDFVIAASSDNKGLITVLGRLVPECKIVNDFKPCSQVGDKLSDVSEALVFDVSTHTPNNKGLSSISSIAVGDFWADAKNLDDICVGDSKRNFVTCYRNVTGDGKFAQAQDAYQFVDAVDTERILKVEFSQPKGNDGPDLLVASSKGFVRWIKGTHNGTFVDETNGPIVTGRWRSFEGGITDMTTASLGQAKKPHVLFVTGRIVTIVPLLADDTANQPICAPSWVMGGDLTKVVAKDFDNDVYGGVVDMLVVDKAPDGVPVWKGLPDGSFESPLLVKLCAKPLAGPLQGGMANCEIGLSTITDMTGDNKPDLLLIGKPTQSIYAPLAELLPPNLTGGCPPVSLGAPALPFPVWSIHLWVNKDGALPAARVAEFNPNASSLQTKSGTTTDCAAGTIESFGSPVGLALGDLDGDIAKSLDLAVVRSDADYYLGLPAKTDKCPNEHLFASTREVDNDYGPENSDPEKGTGLCARNYRADDKDKLMPLKGFGLGAPLKRASLFTFLAGADKNKPFGLDNSHTTTKPLTIGAAYAQSAGINPVGVTIADFTGDKINDVAVAMTTLGNNKEINFLESRVRVFKGDGKYGKLLNVPFAGDKRVWTDALGTLYKLSEVEYRKLYGNPTSLAVAPYGKARNPGLFVMQAATNKVTPLMSTAGKEGPIKITLGDGIVVGDAVQACGFTDFNQDLATDMLCASSNAVGYCEADLSGDEAGFKAKVNLLEAPTQIADAKIADLNQDKYKDLALLVKERSLVKIWLGDGKGGFAQYASELRVAPDVKSLDVVDMNGDGCAEIIVTSKYYVTVLQNLGCKVK
ncbi:MAG: VCBS repeat-containing protein [Myxococcales bacterium]|nr:VCBS repeat-containing protein [Myxococcales bacterium]